MPNKDLQKCLRLCIVFALLSAIVCSVLPVISSTEAREIHVTRLMFVGDSLILPLRNGVVPSKPPLFHWLAQTLSHAAEFLDLFTFGPFGVRLISVCSALTMLLLLYYHTVRRDAALLAVLVLASTPMFIRLALDARVDMLFALLCYLAWIAGVHHRDPRWFWAAVAAAVLAKGPLGLVLPLILCAAATCYLGDLTTWLRSFLRPQAAHLFLCAPLAWYLAAFFVGGDQFVWRIRFENLDRFFEGTPGRPSEAATYLKAIVIKLAPWSWAALWILCRDIRAVFRGKRRALRQAYGCAFLVALLFFVVAAGKRDAYLLPLIPLLASYVACSAPPLERVRSWLESSSALRLRRLLLQTLGGLTLCFLLFVLLSSWFSPVGARFLSYLSTHALALSLALLIVVLATCYEEYRGEGISRVFPFVYVLLLAYGLGLGLKGSLKDFERIAVSVLAQVPIEQRLVVLKKQFEEYFDPLELLLERPLEQRRPASVVDCDAYYLTRRPYFEAIEQPLEILLEAHVLADRVRSRSERDIILFRCAREASDSAKVSEFGKISG